VSKALRIVLGIALIISGTTLGSLPATASTVFNCGTTGTYTVSSGVAISHASCVGDLTLDGTVTSVGAGAFENAQLNAVIIPVGVTAIGIDAFKLARIDSLVFNEGLLTIGASAFADMSKSVSAPPLDITIPNSVTSIGAYAFVQLVLGAVVLGNGTTTILQGTFYNNFGQGATSMQLGANVSTIEATAFLGLRATNVEFPDSLRSIDANAFSESALQSVVFPDELTTVHVDAFSHSGSLTAVLYCGSSPGVPNTLFAPVSCVQSTVTFRSNWESDSTSAQTKTLNRKAQLSTSTLQRAGYSFSGWNEASDGSATAHADGSEYSFASDLILFAQWTQNATPPQPPAVSAPQPPTQPTPQLVSLVTIEQGKDAKYSVLRVALGQTSWAEPILGIQVRLLDTKGNLIRMFVVPLELGTNEVELDLKLPKGSFDVEVVTLSQNGQSQPVVSLPGLASQAFFNRTSKFEEPTLEGTSVSRPILFDGNSSTLRPKAKIGLRRLAERITADERAISLTGFSAKWSSGESYAEKLATKRAKRVGAFLKRQGVTTWVYFAGYGTLEGEANLASARKVEIRLLD
jgi:outer membrane protein OmpA-like peptidoglycan-associated protein